ncbi:MAG: hypothetical protein A3J07_00870 [Candidatus Doudnabacteria bacterium RIFCSPLOWO2_02_FULL_49_13]|uniref:Uncharacterized protein n=1 Tax=Candidatus Doudnabacteria bacterium RIFCSPHIGHO2_12_FULL_48_16 TaxID=1817838 RepID=A0A1F5PK38_9BACT|nr:MAG: hypothetical protein A2760_04035 [Candidatus Doudnabacteria bacterium RIFCSPHIGHO2_01_FULL_50_67]OGE88891.1 MAG: hypothetical protein A3B77_03870 [Candidatus Doudnabacteria bacterium RIFCSPHIGHO2_02_FULL_49_24]OGE90303.1 MAG: hypothetical protein A3E29_04380 [Candidatus Doudnabacteria bacterium RIFCSPHIGHO2_12_FULL_48_16]OGE96731.1 MAG: hypothetical protein A2990_00370 [Candidatus Doudnabacteria bacterium RIFCSPLOWO2_01_FULL_49_40]OGF02359.1 MAG: hypothetical protein A3J07_00870 [Candid
MKNAGAKRQTGGESGTDRPSRRRTPTERMPTREPGTGGDADDQGGQSDRPAWDTPTDRLPTSDPPPADEADTADAAPDRGQATTAIA